MFAQGYQHPKEYIATQGPIKTTVNDMWYMAWQENTTTIVMVTNTIELSKVWHRYRPICDIILKCWLHVLLYAGSISVSSTGRSKAPLSMTASK